MRNLKRALSLTLASVMLLGMMVMGTSAASFPDVDDNDNVEAVEVLAAVGVIVGENGNYYPDRSVTRNEMAVIMTNMLGLNAKDFAGTCPFTDVPSWAQNYVAACYANGIVAGRSATVYDGQATVTAVEAASMMMRALGYFKYPGDYEGGFTSATVRQAATIRLFDGVAGSATAPMTRNDVAQLALNTLEADMVEFAGNLGFEFNGITQGYQSKYEPRKDLGNTGNKGYDYTDDQNDPNVTTTHQMEYLQLLEDLYDGKLTKNTRDTDNMGHPAYTWVYDGKDVVTTKKTPDYTGYITAKNDTLAKLVDNISKKLDETAPTATYLNGIASAPWAPAVGDYVELYVKSDNANKIDKIVVTHKTVAELTADAATRVVDGDTQVRVPGVTGLTAYNSKITTDDVHGYQGLVEGDIVLWHRAGNADNTAADGWYIEKAQSFTGTLTAADTVNKVYTVGGTKYDESEVTNVLNGITVTDFTKQDATWFVDDDNNIVWVKGEEVTDVAYLIAVKDEADNWTGGVATGSTTKTAMLLLPDNSVVTAEYKNSGKYNGTATDFDAATHGVGAFVKYTVKDGVYTLSDAGTYAAAVPNVSSAKAGNHADGAAGETISATKGNPTITFGTSNTVLTNADTIFFIRDYKGGAGTENEYKNSFAMYNGYANVPTTGSLTIAVENKTVGSKAPEVMAASYVGTNGYAKYVVIYAGTQIANSSSSDEIFYVVDGKVTTLYDADGVAGYSVRAIKNGNDEIEALTFKADPTGNIAAGSAYVINTYDGEKIDNFSVAVTTGTPADCIVGIGAGYEKVTATTVKLGSTAYGMGNDAKIYYVDPTKPEDEQLTVMSVAELDKDDNDDIIAIRGSKTSSDASYHSIVTLFITAKVDPCATHTWGAWSGTTTHTRTCTVCGTAQSHAAAFDTWTVDNGKHVSTCASCTLTDEHTPSGGDWKVAPATGDMPSETVTANQHYQECGDCNLAFAAGHDANFKTAGTPGNYEKDSDNHWLPCQEAGCGVKSAETAHGWAQNASNCECATCGASHAKADTDSNSKCDTCDRDISSDT